MLWDLEVGRCRALADAARRVVVGTVAWAEVPAKVTGVGNGHAAKMRADAKHNKPLVLLLTVTCVCVCVCVCVCGRERKGQESV